MITVSPAEDIAAAYGLKRGTKGFYGPCPFHSGSNKRGLTVLHGADRPIITCHKPDGCDWKHDILPVLMSDGLAKAEKSQYVSREEWIARKKAQQQATRQREAENMQQEEARWNAAAARARAIWPLCKPAAPDHPYLAAKGFLPNHTQLADKYFPARDVMQYKDALAIPVYFDRELVNMQFITTEGKRFLKGGQVKACYHAIQGEKSAPVLLCEGWATGMSLHMATGYPVICALSTANMALAGLHIQQNNPDATLVIAGDNGEAGHLAADKAARVLDCGVIYPEKEYGDFNDASR